MSDISDGRPSDTGAARTARTEADLGAMKNDIRHAARAEAKHDFHAPSRTHVVWCLGVGRGGAKGFGDLADEARRHFEARLDALIENAAAGDLRRWRVRLGEDETTRRREEHVRSLAASRRMGEYSISLDPSQTKRFKASSRSGSLNGAIVQALREGLESVRQKSLDRTSEGMRQVILDKDAALKAARRADSSDLDVRTLRMDAETHARLHLEAHDLGVKLPELCRYAVEVWFLGRERQPEHPTAGRLVRASRKTSGRAVRPEAAVPRATASEDPLTDLLGSVDRDTFLSIADTVGVNTMFLTRVRDRQLEPNSIPALFSERLRLALPRPPSQTDWTAFLHQGARQPAGAMYKSRRKPKAGRRMSFEDAVTSSDLPEAKRTDLLALLAEEADE